MANGALQFIPFGALTLPVEEVKPKARGKAAGRAARKPVVKHEEFQPLIVTHEIVSLPSASTIGVLRGELAGRKPAAKAIAVLADPIFEKDDERITTIAIKAKDDAKPDSSAVGETRLLTHEIAAQSASEAGVAQGGLRIPRLPGTRTEAERIVALSADSRKILDFEANRETVASAQLSQYRIIHFATHGFADSRHPDLSGIVLSMFDKDGKPQDGFLRAHEIFNLNLPAELVVLSACQTGLGAEVRGEGLVGLTRGFMYAGAARVVVSLWSVNDRATSELMVKFYEKMLKQGMRPAEALRAAQVEMWKDEKWRNPFFWAAFQLQGEWRGN